MTLTEAQQADKYGEAWRPHNYNLAETPHYARAQIVVGRRDGSFYLCWWDTCNFVEELRYPSSHRGRSDWMPRCPK